MAAPARLLHPTSLPLPYPSPFQNPNPNLSHCRPSTPSRSSLTDRSLSAKRSLLTLIADQQRGVKTLKDPAMRAKIIESIEEIAVFGADTVTTGPNLSGTWRSLWTTEKEQLFIIENAFRFGTEVGDVLQVIDVENCVLNNVITFPPHGVFFVRSSLEVASPQRVNFRFTSAVLRGENWELPLPPFGKGWLVIYFVFFMQSHQLALCFCNPKLTSILNSENVEF